MSANNDLPVLNPLHVTKARSSLAAFVAFLGTVAPLLPEGWREVAQGVDQGAILAAFDRLAAALVTILQGFNELIALAGMAWLWWERRAPRYRLSLLAPIRRGG